MYRAQFPFPPVPPGDGDEYFTHTFNVGNTPALGLTIPAGGFLRDIPLLLDDRGEYHWHGFKIAGDSEGSSLSAQLKDPFGRYLSDGFVPVDHSGIGSGGVVGTLPVVLEPAIICPPGGVVWLYLYNPTGGTYEVDISVTLYGAKRFTLSRCA